jgi:cytochrome P450
VSDGTSQLPDVPLYRDAREINGFDDIEAILRDFGFNSFTKRIRDEFLGETLVHSDGDRHSRLRRLHSNLFRRDALDFYEQQVVAPAIERSIRDLRDARAADGLVRADLVTVSREALSDMGCRLIGLGDLEDPRRRARFLELAALLISGIVLDTSTASDEDRQVQLELARAGKADFWQEFVAPAVEERRSHAPQAAGTPTAEGALDLLSLLLADDPEISDEMILRNCSMYISGSQGAVIQGVVHTFNNLAMWFAENPERYEERFDVEFLRRAAYETLRLTPPQGILTRVAGHDKQLPSGEQVAEGELVAVQLALAHRNEGIFGACPHAMQPDREPARDGTPLFGLAFGAGRHVCIGRRLALPAGGSDGDPEGIMLRMLQALYAAGAAPDPDDPPVVGANARGHFEHYPVTFDSL